MANPYRSGVSASDIAGMMDLDHHACVELPLSVKFRFPMNFGSVSSLRYMVFLSVIIEEVIDTRARRGECCTSGT